MNVHLTRPIPSASPGQSYAPPELRVSERQWDIRSVARNADGHQARVEHLLDEGWEPYGADDYGKHFRRRIKGNDRAVVIPRNALTKSRHLHRDLFQDWHVIVAVEQYGVLQSRPQLMFERIVMTWKPKDGNQLRWVRDRVLPRLIPPATIEWLY